MKYRRPKKTIAAAVRIEIPLYQHALRKVEGSDTNFSQYVRSLIRRDLASTGVLVESK
jgi:hypothetical protein